MSKQSERFPGQWTAKEHFKSLSPADRPPRYDFPLSGGVLPREDSPAGSCLRTHYRENETTVLWWSERTAGDLSSLPPSSWLEHSVELALFQRKRRKVLLAEQ